jgi:hypothetical protein
MAGPGEDETYPWEERFSEICSSEDAEIVMALNFKFL